MTYADWLSEHKRKHANVLKKLQKKSYSKEETIEYFEFENMVNAEPDFCPLYAQYKKCHEMERLNCYLCACPHFAFNDDGLYEKEGFTTYSECSINHGSKFTHENKIHHDCSECIIPHKKAYVQKRLEDENS